MIIINPLNVFFYIKAADFKANKNKKMLKGLTTVPTNTIWPANSWLQSHCKAIV